MKKLALALICLVSVAFFASCDPEITDYAPTATVVRGAEYVSGTIDNPTIIALDDNTNYKYGFNFAANALSRQALSTVTIVMQYTMADGTTGSSEVNIDVKGKMTYDYEQYVFEQSKTMYDAFTVTATVTDAVGEEQTATIAYKVEVEDNLVAQPFKWERYNGANGTGLAEFGLKWNDNIQRAFYAIIKPLEGAKLYNITNTSTWDDIKTAADKNAFFAEQLPAFDISQFGDIVLGNTTPNFLLATVYNGQNYLIHITKTTATNRAWDYTIEGEYK